MKKYKYYFAFIITAIICFLIFFYCKNNINLMNFVTYYYEVDSNSNVVPVVSIDYLALSAEIGNKTKEEVEKDVAKETGALNILDSLSGLLTSDYSNFINSVEVSVPEKNLKEGDTFHINITWDKNLADNINLQFTSYNNVIKIKNPENNSLYSSIINIFKEEEKTLDVSHTYFLINSINNENVKLYPFEKYKIMKYDNNNVKISNNNINYVVNRKDFEKYFIKDISSFLNFYLNLNKNDLGFVILSFIIFFPFSLICYFLLKKLTKDDSLYLSYLSAICFIIIIAFSKGNNTDFIENIFLLPNSFNFYFIIFSLKIFIIFSLLFEFFFLFSKNIIKTFICIILLILMNASLLFSVFGCLILLVIIIFKMVFKNNHSVKQLNT